MASASPEIFDKDTFLQEILNENDPVRLLHIRKKYATQPYCAIESSSWLDYALKQSISVVDGYGYYCYSITNIIFDKLDESERKDVLDHIQKVCKRVPKKWHILTDIDDTIKVSSTGGTNVKYKNHTVYPGVVSFYDKIIKTDTDFVTLLSARPEILAKGSRKDISKELHQNVDMLTGKFIDMPGAICDMVKRKCVSITPSFAHEISKVIYNYPTKLTHISGSEPTEWYNNYKKMGTTKFESILKYISIFPEFKFIFIGDSGQGDLICANKINQQGSDFPVKASFIHNILKARELTTHYDRNYDGPIDSMLMIGEPLRKKLKKKNIYLFNNYIDLAGYTSCLGLLNSTDLERVISETITDFNEDTLNKPSKKKLTYSDTPLFISYIENDLLRAQEEWSGKENMCK